MIADVAVVGGGVIGLALARELSARGLDVVVLERGRAGEEASWAAAGLLTAQSDAAAPSAFFRFARESRDLYPGWTEALRQETGLDSGWRPTGVLRCGPGATLDRFGWQVEEGMPVEVLDRAEALRRSGGRIAPAVPEGLFFPSDSVVHSRWLVAALRRSLAIRGVPVREGVAVVRFLVSGGKCVGVETSAGDVSAAQVVDAAGAWANLDPTVFSVSVEPIRGQIVELEDDGPFPTVLESDDVYLVPRADGRILVGATVERCGFRKEVTAAGVASLLSAALLLSPSLENARVSGAWSGLRPGTPDGMPLLGESPLRGLYLACGHFRNGILLAPITALRLADLLTGVEVSDLIPFAPGRFARAESVAPDDRGLFG
ncbi:MAG TPA: glycine oxidase ThiO [Thermoanaerobaculia bacterium]|nr:glycine oxidase ThiO [Thermoanaerobaculia bacterium]